jgi:hypothetical protein
MAYQRQKSAPFRPASCSCKMAMNGSSVRIDRFNVRLCLRADSSRRRRIKPAVSHQFRLLNLIDDINSEGLGPEVDFSLVAVHVNWNGGCNVECRTKRGSTLAPTKSVISRRSGTGSKRLRFRIFSLTSPGRVPLECNATDQSGTNG